MKIYVLLAFLTLVVLATARAVPGHDVSSDAIITSSSALKTEGGLFNYTTLPIFGLNSDEDDNAAGSSSASSGANPPSPDAQWCKFKTRGLDLMKAMMMSEEDARVLLGWPYVQSPWDGDMRKDLETWDYLDTDELHEVNDANCDFAGKHELGDVFRDGLQVDPRSSRQGGPNHCFFVQHSDSPAMIRDQNDELPDVKLQRYWINGREYRATDAEAAIGVNPTDGLVYFVMRKSPEEAAKETWGRSPPPHELPALRSSSDLAFGFWNRVATSSTRGNLKYFMACIITNDDTEAVIERALQIMNIDDVQVWPGTDFELSFGPGRGEEIDAALALLGSPNGLGVGYFLIQHKLQFGWKYVSKVRVFKSDDDLTYLLFYVTDKAPWEGPVEQVDERLEKTHITKRWSHEPAKARAFARNGVSKRKSKKGKGRKHSMKVKL